MPLQIVDADAASAILDNDCAAVPADRGRTSRDRRTYRSKLCRLFVVGIGRIVDVGKNE